MREKIFGYLWLSLAATTISLAATLTVDLTGGADYTDILSTIDAAADGDSVRAKVLDLASADSYPASFAALGDRIFSTVDGNTRGRELRALRVEPSRAPGCATALMECPQDKSGADESICGTTVARMFGSFSKGG